MISFLFEQPWVIGAAGTIVTAATFYGWLQSGNQSAFKLACTFLAATLLLVLLNVTVETDSEVVHRWIDDAAGELSRNEHQKIMNRIHPECTPMIDNCILRMKAVRFTDFRVTRIHSIEVARNREAPQAIVKMNVVAEATMGGQYADFKGKLARWVQLKLEKVNDHWLVLDLDEREPQHEFMGNP
jgi:hypothetical protein